MTLSLSCKPLLGSSFQAVFVTGHELYGHSPVYLIVNIANQGYIDLVSILDMER